MVRRENEYQAYLIKRLRGLFPHCLILKNDPNYLQGIPDLLVLNGPLWVALEVKASRNSPTQSNQRYYVEEMNGMAFAAFIFPENEEEILYAIQRTFSPRRIARLPKSQWLPLAELRRSKTRG